MLARMGCVVFHWDLVGYCDSTKIDHRTGFTDAESILRLQSFMGLQGWNGIRALDLAFALSDGYEGAVLVDAVSRGSPPGTLYVIEPGVDDAPAECQPLVVETHNIDPVTVLRLARAVGGRLPWLRLVGCEPATVDEGTELSSVVEASIDGAVEVIEGLVTEFFAGVEATRP